MNQYTTKERVLMKADKNIENEPVFIRWPFRVLLIIYLILLLNRVYTKLFFNPSIYNISISIFATVSIIVITWFLCIQIIKNKKRRIKSKRINDYT
jgi:hypothetical protein